MSILLGALNVLFRLFLQVRTNPTLVFFQFSPEKFAETMKLMEHRYGAKDFETSKDTSLLSPGTFYLTKVDSMFRRYYDKKGAEDANANTEIKTLANGH